MTAPLIALVVPVYDVEPYLPEFLRSLERQTIPVPEIEVVLVDDGSTDRSGSLLASWAEGREGTRVVRHPHGGLAAARNAGLQEVRAPWVTFPDPDDVLHPQYLERVAAAIRAGEDRGLALCITNLIFYDDSTGLLRDKHPLRHRFHAGDRVIDLDRAPTHIHLSGPSGFYRTALIRSAGLTFDPRVRPNFEDAHFTARYLVRSPSGAVAVVASAEYYYRKRATEDSLVQASWRSRAKYTTLLRHGHLGALQDAAAQLGTVPEWLQRTVLYDLFLYLSTDAGMSSATGALTQEVTDELHDLMEQIVAHIDVEVLRHYEASDPNPVARAALLARFKGEGGRPSTAQIDKVDHAQRSARLVYRFTGTLPTEQLLLDGRAVVPTHAKVRTIEYYGQTYLRERIAWIPVDGALEVLLDGTPVPVTTRTAPSPRVVTRPDQVLGHLVDRTGEPLAAALDRAVGSPTPTSRSGDAPSETAAPPRGTDRSPKGRSATPRSIAATARRRVRAAAAALVARPASPPPPRPGRGAWLLMDRDTQANDNAEHLHRHLQRERPDIDAWFVLREDSPDWPRLVADGFRMVPYGSATHRDAIRHAAHLVSAQTDDYVLRPFGRGEAKRYRYRFTFLAHGVAKQDISRWINPKPIDLLTTTSPAEHRSIVADDTPYVLTTKEVRLTGMPRHDALWRLALAHPPERRDLVLVAPSWRRGLVGPTKGATNARKGRDDFWASQFATEWMAVLGSEQMRAALAERGLRLGFAPHPNFEMYLADAPLPGHVEIIRGSTVDFWAVLASARLVVTDYSSVAFDAALIQRPVVYFQFDPEVAYGADHYFRPGYFSYERDGFGPVTTTGRDAVQRAIGALDHGPTPAAPYLDRMEAAFAHRDDRASARVLAAIEDLDRSPG